MFPRPKNIGAALLAALTLTAVGATGPAIAQPSGRQCPGLYVVTVPGTWETSVDEPRQGMLSGAVDGLPGDVRVDHVAYAATAFPWEGEVYGRSKREALDKARAMVAGMADACASTRIALVGYSQGADAAGDLAAEIGTGNGVVAPERVVLVGLISDPRRSPVDNLIGPRVPGAGAGGPRAGFGRVTARTFTFCASGDLYCAMPEGDFAGRIAGLLAELSNPDPQHAGRYVQEASDLAGAAIAAGGVGLLAGQLDARAVEQRRAQIEDFLKSGIHQSYPGYEVGPDGQTPLSWLRQCLIESADDPDAHC
ncbi:cutinase family protein [Nocardia sp. NPDC052254]|uniref:cutinase family protein n=1 Tax=Nocardia sp. NPDC052254 TaxID=3155681 RepID=UPI00342580E8